MICAQRGKKWNQIWKPLQRPATSFREGIDSLDQRWTSWEHRAFLFLNTLYLKIDFAISDPILAVCFLTGSHWVALAELEFIMWNRMVLNS